MRGILYLLALAVSVSAAVYFGMNGQPLIAVLCVFPGYLVLAYLVILISTFLPGDEKERFEAARTEAMRRYLNGS